LLISFHRQRLLGSGETSSKIEAYRNGVVQSAAVPLALFADPRIEAAISGRRTSRSRI
jgi:hypothetical protein